MDACRNVGERLSAHFCAPKNNFIWVRFFNGRAFWVPMSVAVRAKALIFAPHKTIWVCFFFNGCVFVFVVAQMGAGAWVILIFFSECFGYACGGALLNFQCLLQANGAFAGRFWKCFLALGAVFARKMQQYLDLMWFLRVGLWIIFGNRQKFGAPLKKSVPKPGR